MSNIDLKYRLAKAYSHVAVCLAIALWLYSATLLWEWRWIEAIVVWVIGSFLIRLPLRKWLDE